MSALNKIRIDKWLWAIRIFKTRSLASEACKAGRVKIEGKSVKSSRNIMVGDTVSVQKGQEKKIVKAVRLIEKRVGAPIAVECYEDLSPAPDPKDKKLGSFFIQPVVAQRKRGSGRPTKKERRNLDKLQKE